MICIALLVTLTVITTYASVKIQNSKNFISLLTLANIEALSNWEWSEGGGTEWSPGWDTEWWIGKDVPGLEGKLVSCRLDLGGGWGTASVEWICELSYDSSDNNCTPRPCGF